MQPFTGSYNGNGYTISNLYIDRPPLFKSVTVEISLPNRYWKFGPDGPYWTPGAEYTTVDKVFIPATTELGDTRHVDIYPIGKVYPFFVGAENADLLALFDHTKDGYGAIAYRTRSPKSCYTNSNRLLYVTQKGTFLEDMFGNVHWTSPALSAVNLLAATPVSAVANTDGVYEIWGGAMPAASNADLSALAVAPGSLTPAFDRDTAAYTVEAAHTVSSIDVTAILSDENATITISDDAANSGEP